MKKSFTFVAALAASLLIFSCKPVATPVSSVPEKPEDPIPDPTPDPEEDFDPDYAHPGNVETISFTISDIPADKQYIYIFRKYNTDNKFEYYACCCFYDTTQNHSLTFEDKFVKTDKTYNYRYSLDFNCKDFVDITNGETKNFTPATGLGELEYKAPLPEISYTPATTELSFSKALEFFPDVDTLCTKTDAETQTTYPVYSKGLLLGTENSWISNTIDYSKTTFNIRQTFMYAQGDYEFKYFSPTLLYSINVTNDDENSMTPYREADLWYCGKKYDITDKNVIVHFPVDFGVKNVDNGIEVTFSRKNSYDPSWVNTNIDIYEDGQKLDYYFGLLSDTVRLMNTNSGTEMKFVFPFTKKGKQYTFKFSPDNKTTFERTITAEYTSSLQIDRNKLEDNFRNMKYSYIEADTETENIRLLKLSPNANDIFTGRTDSNLKHVAFELSLFASPDNENYYYQGYIKSKEAYTSKMLSDGINFLEDGVITTNEWVTKIDDCKSFYFTSFIIFSVEDEENNCGFFWFSGNRSENFAWTPIRTISE